MRQNWASYLYAGCMAVALSLGVWGAVRPLVPQPAPVPPRPPVPTNVIDAPAGEMTKVSLPAPALDVLWIVPPSQAKDLRIIAYPDHAILNPVVGKVADYDFAVVTRESESGKIAIKWWVIRSGKGPQPPPTPPRPVDPVDPVDPPVPVNPSPFAATGFRVLVVYEDSKAAPKLTSKQSDELYGAAFSSYMNAECVKGPDGRTAEFRIWEKSTPLAGASELWRQAMGRSVHAAPPTLMFGDGTTGWEGPLPDGGILDFIKSKRKKGAK
jgi:hypothetical protein